MDYILLAGAIAGFIVALAVIVLVSVRKGKLSLTKNQLDAGSQLIELALMSTDIYDFANRAKLAYAAGGFDTINKESLQILRDLQKRKTNILEKHQVDHITGEK